MTCGRVVINPGPTYTSSPTTSVGSGEQTRSLLCAVALPTKRIMAAPVALTEVQLHMPVLNGRPYDYVVTAMYGKHDGRKYSQCSPHFCCIGAHAGRFLPRAISILPIHPSQPLTRSDPCVWGFPHRRLFRDRLGHQELRHTVRYRLGLHGYSSTCLLLFDFV